MRLLPIFVFAFALVSVAQAQPWRVKKDGRIIWTNNVEDLPPKARQIVLERWAKEKAEKAAAAANPETAPAKKITPETNPEMFPQVGAAAVRANNRANPPQKQDGAQKPKPPSPEAARRAKARAEAARLEEELQVAKGDLVQARRKAYEVPSGQAYDARNKAADKVRLLESQLARAKSRVGPEKKADPPPAEGSGAGE